MAKVNFLMDYDNPKDISAHINHDVVCVDIEDINLGFWIDLDGSLIFYGYLLFDENEKRYVCDFDLRKLRIGHKIIKDRIMKKIIKENGQVKLVRVQWLYDDKHRTWINITPSSKMKKQQWVKL